MVLGYLGGPLQNVVYHFYGTIQIKIKFAGATCVLVTKICKKKLETIDPEIKLTEIHIRMSYNILYFIILTQSIVRSQCIVFAALAAHWQNVANLEGTSGFGGLAAARELF